MRSRSIAAGLLLVVAAAGCSSKPVTRAGHTPVIDETIAPQVVAPSGVEILISPERASSGTIRVRTRLTDVARAWTASHVWLDRETPTGWETVWLLDTDAHSASVDEFRRGGVPLSALGVRVPGTLQLILSPAPPPGRYRVRVGVYSGAPETEHDAVPMWATGRLDVG